MDTATYQRIKNLEKLTDKDYSLIEMILRDDKNIIIEKIIREYPILKICVNSESRQKVNEFIEYYMLDNYFEKIKSNMYEKYYIDINKLNEFLSYEQINNVISYLYDYIDELLIYTVLRQLNLISL